MEFIESRVDMTKFSFTEHDYRGQIVSIIETELETIDENVLVKIPQHILEKILLSSTGTANVLLDYDFLPRLDLSEFKYTNLYKECIPDLIKYGIVINPQEIYDKDLSIQNFRGANFSGTSFDGCKIYCSSFKDSIGARINPQTIEDRDCRNVVFSDVEIIGSFDDCQIFNTDFRGSKGAVIDPRKVRNKDCSFVNFDDVILIGGFEGCCVNGVPEKIVNQKYQESVDEDVQLVKSLFAKYRC